MAGPDFNASNYQAIVVDGPHSDWRSDLIAGANVNVYSAGTNSIPEKDGNYTTLYTRIYYTGSAAQARHRVWRHCLYRYTYG